MVNTRKLSNETPVEVWKEAPEKLWCGIQLLMLLQASYIHGLICEEGVIAPQSIVEVMHRSIPMGFQAALRLSTAPMQLSVPCVF